MLVMALGCGLRIYTFRLYPRRPIDVDSSLRSHTLAALEAVFFTHILYFRKVQRYGRGFPQRIRTAAVLVVDSKLTRYPAGELAHGGERAQSGAGQLQGS